MSKYYSHPNLARDVTESELKSLLDLVEHPGWKVYKDLLRVERDSAVFGGMALQAGETTWNQHRGVFHCRCLDLEFDKAILEAEEKGPGLDADIPPTL